MASRSKRKIVLEYFFVLCFLGGGVCFTHLWITDKLKIYRFFYPLEALFSAQSIACNDEAPEWLDDLVLYSVGYRGALANQVAYLSPSGELSYCSSGWKENFFYGGVVNNNTKFRYASLTKVVTASVVLTLIKEQKLHLSDSIGSLFPEISVYKDERVGRITVENLLNHTAGFNRIGVGDPMFIKNKKPWCPYSIETLSQVELAFSPGEKQEYSNLGYCLLGVIAERVSGVKFRDLVEEKDHISRYDIIFSDGFFLADEVIPDFRNDEYYDYDYYRYFDFGANSSAASLVGSASSLAKLVKEIFIKSETFFLLPSSYKNCDESKIRGCYGFALYKYKRPNEELIVYVQEGYLPGASNVLFVDNYGGVLVLLNAGVPIDQMIVNTVTYEKIYRMLSEHYQKTPVSL